MELSVDLISQFAKLTKEKEKPKSETTVYGVTVEYEGRMYVRFDGSDLLTPVLTTTDMVAGERVSVLLKNHTATVTGNLTSPSARTDDMKAVGNVVGELSSKISEFEIIVADKVTTKDIDAINGRIDELSSDNITVKQTLTAAEGDIEKLEADVLTVNETLTAANADIENLKTNKLDVTIANVTYAKINDLNATNADLHNLTSTFGDFKDLSTDKFTAFDADIEKLQTSKLSATDIEGKYANIDFSNISEATMELFYANSGLIENVTIGDGTITGKLVGVTIRGDLIEGNTIKAEKLVIKGTDGLYYKLNTNGVTTEAEQTNYNSLNGSIITANSITASKINVDDLVAFDATIGGFNITSSSLYSGVKSTVSNTTRGIYLDKDGQIAFGDTSNYLKYYKDQNGVYKLAIAANDIILSSSNKSVSDAITDVDEKVDNLSIGGRNLLKDSRRLLLNSNNSNLYPIAIENLTEGTRSFRRYTRTDNSLSPTTMSLYSTIRLSQLTEYLPGTEMTFSYLVRCSHEVDVTTMCVIVINGVTYQWAPNDDNQSVGTEWKRIAVTATIQQTYESTDTVYLRFNPLQIAIPSGEIDNFYLDVCEWKIEKGNKATDWTPAPEDMATNDDVDVVQKSVDSAEERVDDAMALIGVLTEAICTLVTDGNGQSLMTQTANGWTFSTGELQDLVNTTSENLAALIEEMGDVNAAIKSLLQSVKDLGAIGEYVKIVTYEDEPCIELGDRDNEFKLLITNTRIMFMEGSGIPAYINNQSLYIKKAVIEEEMQQGEFVWKVRSNGNLGLTWKG